MQVLESHSPLSKLRSITPYDHYAVGKQLEQFEVYKELCEDNGTAAQLGKLPDLAFDIITVNYGTSPISALASVQPLDEEQGTIYYKNVFAVSKRGSVDPTAGPEMIVGATQMENRELMGYAGDTLTQAVAGGTVDADLTYTTTVGYGPIKPGTVIVTVPALNLTAVDNMQGKLVGYNLQGLINYVTGVVDIQFIQNPGAGHAINVTYATDFEMTDTLPQIQFKLDTKSVRAKVYALKDTVGLEQSYALRRRFGLIAEDEIANDMISAINSELMNTLVSIVYNNAMGNTTWKKAPDSGTSYYEHKLTFKDTIAEAESVMLANAGRGVINNLLVGRNAGALLSTLPGFTKISDGTTIGPHIYGKLDGTTVIRVPNTNILPANVIVGMYNSGNPFEAPVVYAPYMPLVVTTALPNGTNPLMNQRACAVWAACEVLVPRFITKITIDPVTTIDPLNTGW
jgi:hypothetical protein